MLRKFKIAPQTTQQKEYLKAPSMAMDRINQLTSNGHLCNKLKDLLHSCSLGQEKAVL